MSDGLFVREVVNLFDRLEDQLLSTLLDDAISLEKPLGQ